MIAERSRAFGASTPWNRLLDLELAGDVAGGVVVLGSDSRATLALRAMWT